LSKMFTKTCVLLVSILVSLCECSTLSYQSDDGCSVIFDSIGSAFDLCPLTIATAAGQISYYKVLNSRSVNTSTTSTEDQYEYYFNIGAPLPIIPPICNATSHAYCDDDADCSLHDNGSSIAMTSNAWAYQVRINSESNTADGCWAIGNDAIEWQLIDDEDPSLGIVYTLLHGDYDDFVCHKNRKFRVEFRCEDTTENIGFIPDESPMFEHAPCEYTLTVLTPYGCPVQCKEYEHKICGRHGICGYDNSNEASHCFCFDQYDGDDCSIHDAQQAIPDSAAKPVPSGLGVVAFENALNTSVTVVYDLRLFWSAQSMATQNGGVYIVHDKEDDRGYTYYVGVKEMLDASAADSVLPSFCRDILAPCAQIEAGECVDSGESQQWNGKDGLVFQVLNETQECYVLGRFDARDSPLPLLYDTVDDPARGLTLLYQHGAWCGAAHDNRKFMVNLVCPRDASAVFDPYTETEVAVYEYVEEVSTCVYAFTMESAIACPYQCITNGTTESDPHAHAFTVCSQRGICAADPEAGFVRCLCDDGWTGVYCDERDTQSPTLQPTTTTATKGSVTTPSSASITPQTASVDAVNGKSNTSLVVSIVVLVVVICVVLSVGFIVYRNQKMRISQQEDELAFHRMDPNQQTNVVTDVTGNTRFESLDDVQAENNVVQ